LAGKTVEFVAGLGVQLCVRLRASVFANVVTELTLHPETFVKVAVKRGQCYLAIKGNFYALLVEVPNVTQTLSTLRNAQVAIKINL
jgi:hypothetical protein